MTLVRRVPSLIQADQMRGHARFRAESGSNQSRSSAYAASSSDSASTVPSLPQGLAQQAS